MTFLYNAPTQLEVQSPPGNTVGYVIQQWHPFSPKFIVANENNEPVLKINGPFCGWSCLPDVDFEVGFAKTLKCFKSVKTCHGNTLTPGTRFWKGSFLIL